MTDFGKKVKIALVNMGHSQKWLIDEITKKTGLYCDTSYLCKVMNGKNNNPKIVSAINEILSISE